MKVRSQWSRWLAPLIGLGALIWFLVRVIPKPSRATYPCQRAVFPLASAFVIWLMGICGSWVGIRRARSLFRQQRFGAGVCLLGAVVGLAWITLEWSTDREAQALEVLPNQPIGTGRGLAPGRVVWAHATDVTDWEGPGHGLWYDHVDPDAAARLTKQAICAYAGPDVNETAAWDLIFRHFNEARGRGAAGYSAGEKIMIKINMNTTNAAVGTIRFPGTPLCDAQYNWTPRWAEFTEDSVGNTNELLLALLDQLVNVAGVTPADITMGDPLGLMPNYQFDVLHEAFPEVRLLDNRGTYGRTRAELSDVPFYWSTGAAKGRRADYLPRAYAEATYVINYAILKSHVQGGITVCAKNHYGSLLRNPSGWLRDVGIPNNPPFYDMHLSLPDLQGRTGQYRALVDLMGHENLGGKTLLYLIDAVYAGRNWSARAARWRMAPFKDDWPQSLFVSMDPVAIDSVAFDFLSRQWPEHANMNAGVTDYLVEAALADQAPSGTIYDPERDGVPMTSLGVHEHWNNAIDKQYSRNLDPEAPGIELLKVDATGPLQQRINRADEGDILILPPGVYHERIDLTGKTLTLRSEDPNDPQVVARTILQGKHSGPIVTIGADSQVRLEGLTLQGGKIGLHCVDASPRITGCVIEVAEEAGVHLEGVSNPQFSYCIIRDHMGPGVFGHGNTDLTPIFDHCLITGNSGHSMTWLGIKSRRDIIFPMVRLAHCTLADNAAGAIQGGALTVTHSILWSSGADAFAPNDAQVTYSCVQGGWEGAGNQDWDPLFVGDADYHLQSTAGHWDRVLGVWTVDNVTSPAIDAGDPLANPVNEPFPNGNRINIGAYGGTVQASKSP